MLNFNDIKSRMEKAVAIFIDDAATIRTGRATPGLIENLMVTVYGGQKMRLQELGSIGVPDVRTLTFQPWDQALIREIANEIMAANVGMNPVVDNNLIRISLPMLTVEQRNEYVKLLGRKREGVVKIIRDDIRGEERRKLTDAKNKKEISEDDFRREETELQKTAENFIAKVDELTAKKEKEILGN